MAEQQIQEETRGGGGDDCGAATTNTCHRLDNPNNNNNNNNNNNVFDMLNSSKSSSDGIASPSSPILSFSTISIVDNNNNNNNHCNNSNSNSNSSSFTSLITSSTESMVLDSNNIAPTPMLPVRGHLLYKANRIRRMTSTLPSGHRSSTWNGFNHLKTQPTPKPNHKEKRTNILKEILSTEQAYVSFLTVLLDVYLAKMREKEVLAPDDITTIFSNIDAIKSANDEILARLKERIEVLNNPSLNNNNNNIQKNQDLEEVEQQQQEEGENKNNQNNNNNNNVQQTTTTTTTTTTKEKGEEEEELEQVVQISDIFIELGPFLKIYSIFVHNYYKNAMKMIKDASKSKKFKAYHNECKYTPFARKLELNDLMIMPIQRLPRYILLLEELIQYTPIKTLNNEKEKLQEAKSIMKEVVSYVNQSTHQDTQDPQQLLAIIQQQLGPKAGHLIQPHRRLVKFGELDRLVINADGAPKKRKIGVYLFNDIVIYALNKKFWRQLSLSEVWIRSRNIEECETFEIYSQDLSCIFLNTDTDSLDWPLLIQDTINSFLENDNDAMEKRKKILEDLQDRSDITFEEKQFFFESVSNINSNGKGGDDKNSNSIIEKGIVSDRKKKLEHLLLERRNILSDNEDMMMMEDHSSLSDIDNRPSSPLSSPTMGGSPIPKKSGESKKSKKKREKQSINNNNNNNNGDSGSSSSPKTSRKHPSTSYLIRTTSTKMLFTAPSNSKRLLHIVLMKNNITKEGYLTKVGGVVKNWKRRWFIMENGYLFYLKDRNDSQQLGTIALIGSTIESISIEGKSFSIVTKHRTFMLMGDTEEEIREWTSVIQQFYSERQSTILRYANQLTTSVKDIVTGTSPGQDGWRSASPLSRSTSAISLHSSMDEQVQRRLASFRSSKNSNSDINRSTDSFGSEMSTSPPSPKWRMTTGHILSNRKEFIGNHHIDEETDDDDEDDEDDSYDDELYHQNLGDDDDDEDDDEDEDDEEFSDSSDDSDF
ncbi:pleckstrin domain-containing protein [Cavenderia fasciculata]|uniref:Pleckstrin domain-containing protein n=1 Tax=Cavenderia fasciculata TaxID=261658 RepID=F4PIU6_CACFS|nr:pleckstrin domain-containing protein [Cavenderia fasciculata]EGG24675.1 pleckstrin domain-containing protein [Cavenderia fasciculata]|eukprot:XP_004362526.1 pleckstrin domain-containing protein [Cavenderia fasciculata]